MIWYALANPITDHYKCVEKDETWEVENAESCRFGARQTKTWQGTGLWAVDRTRFLLLGSNGTPPLAGEEYKAVIRPYSVRGCFFKQIRVVPRKADVFRLCDSRHRDVFLWKPNEGKRVRRRARSSTYSFIWVATKWACKARDRRERAWNANFVAIAELRSSAASASAFMDVAERGCNTNLK